MRVGKGTYLDLAASFGEEHEVCELCHFQYGLRLERVHRKTYAFLVAPGSSRSTSLGRLALGGLVIRHIDVGWTSVRLGG
jgi:hypothetical protein